MQVISLPKYFVALSIVACSSNHQDRTTPTTTPTNGSFGGGMAVAGSGGVAGGVAVGTGGKSTVDTGTSSSTGSVAEGGKSTVDTGTSNAAGSVAEGGKSTAGAGSSGAGMAGNGGIGIATLELQIGAPGSVTRLTQLSSTDANELYVVGWTNGAVGDIACIGAIDAVAMKFDAKGERRWVHHLGAPGIAPGIVTKAWDAATTPEGELVIVGLVNGRGLFHGELLSSTFTAFVAALSSDGHERWLRLLGGTDGTTEAMGVEVLANGTIAVAGVTSASTLHDQLSLGASDAFVAWLSPQGDVLRLLRYGGADEEYPSAFGSRNDDLYMARVITPRVVTDTQPVELLHLDANGAVKNRRELTGETVPQVAAFSSIENAICATLAYATYSPEAGAGADYGYQCFSDEFIELSSVRRGTPGAQAIPTSMSCASTTNCAIAGYAASSFEGDPIASSGIGFVVELGEASGLSSLGRFAATNVDPDAYVRATALTRRRDGTLVVGGDVGATLFEPLHGIADIFVAAVNP